MPGKLALAGRDKVLDRDIKLAESNLPSWLREAAIADIRERLDVLDAGGSGEIGPLKIDGGTP